MTHIPANYSPIFYHKISNISSQNDFFSIDYTTNPIESVNRCIKKVTKNKAIFPNEQAVFKVIYLALREADKKWTSRLRDWPMIYSQLMIFFEERMEAYL